MGHHTSRALQTMIEGAYRHHANWIATGAGFVTFLLTATSAFAEIQGALNEIWRVTPPASTMFQLLRTRLVSLGLVLTLGFVLLVSLVLSAGMSAIGDRIEVLAPGMGLILRGVNAIISLLLIAILFGAIYKVLPDRDIPWRDALMGAVVSTVLFAAGKYGIGFYIGSSNVSSSYGAAGALIVLLLWIYFSATIFLFGAEVARAYAERRGDLDNRR
jgi:membrane protein